MSSDPVLDAALALISEGSADFTMETLAARAGVGRATLYRRYPSRARVLEALKPLLPETPASQERPAARTRTLDALTHLLETHGPLHLTMEQVAEAADVNPVTLFRIFGDKRAMLQAWFDERSPRQAYEAIFAQADQSLETVLSLLLAEMFRFSVHHPGMVRLMLFASPEELAFLNALNMVQGQTRLRLLAFLKDRQAMGELLPQSPELLTLAIASIALAGPQLGNFRHRIEPDRAGTARALIRLLLHGALEAAAGTEPSPASASQEE